ncbi:hypothetical protein FOZ60_007113 [Perkinsus olseni]|uniref:Uncharacterized protein n=1 Tax=Perkinsus olseni TaxID=32597 RepID=A0A7J6NPG0_PEROL|nr:hypothetical protein FOZ60_007113 [Perkinsus olseni]
MVEKDGVMVNKWLKESYDGIDPSTGANFSVSYLADLAPDTWTLYMDEKNDKPLNLVASNRRNNDDIDQEITFTNFQGNDGVLTSEKTHELVCELYNIDDGEPLTQPATGDTAAPDTGHLSFRDNLLSGHGQLDV